MVRVPAGALELTVQMRDAAGRGDWDRLAELESRRVPVLAAVLVEPDGAAQETLVHIAMLNRDIAALVDSGLERLRGDLIRLARLRRARAAYLGTAGGVP